jgi:hypothetical protein
MVANPDLHRPRLDLEVGMADCRQRAGCEADADGPAGIVRFWAAARTSSRLPPVAALAPPIFHMKISPATPRRLLRSSGGAEATSSLAITVTTSMPSLATVRAAIFTFMLSPA